MVKLIGTNASRSVVSLIGVAIFLVGAYIDKPYKADIFLEVEVLLFLAGIFVGLFIFQLILCLALSEKHEGWKRVSLVLGGAGGVYGGLLYDGRLSDVHHFVEILAHAGAGVLVGLSIIMLGRWVVRGFAG